MIAWIAGIAFIAIALIYCQPLATDEIAPCMQQRLMELTRCCQKGVLNTEDISIGDDSFLALSFQGVIHRVTLWWESTGSQLTITFHRLQIGQQLPKYQQMPIRRLHSNRFLPSPRENLR